MMKRKSSRVSLIAAAIVLSLVPVAASAATARVDVCHVEGNGSYQLITMAEAAFSSHLEHGDAAPDSPIPEMVGYTFGDDCQPVQPVDAGPNTAPVAGTIVFWEDWQFGINHVFECTMPDGTSYEVSGYDLSECAFDADGDALTFEIVDVYSQCPGDQNFGIQLHPDFADNGIFSVYGPDDTWEDEGEFTWTVSDGRESSQLGYWYRYNDSQCM